jgi:hypothetical protein
MCKGSGEARGAKISFLVMKNCFTGCLALREEVRIARKYVRRYIFLKGWENPKNILFTSTDLRLSELNPDPGFEFIRYFSLLPDVCLPDLQTMFISQNEKLLLLLLAFGHK